MRKKSTIQKSIIEKTTIEARHNCTRIFFDGEEIKGVHFFKIEQRVGQELPVVTIEIVTKEIEFVGESVIAIEKPTP